jgi:hypothetical protein
MTLKNFHKIGRGRIENAPDGRETRTPRDVENFKIEARAGCRRSVEPITPLVESASCCSAI